ncbi:hypothetical protein [Sciscionella marina]|uniref:hypothetical protein n=1 Tax=Sciscionella marina TaxID=508770 RepID=UPI000368DA7D|nr:hypothetical protein [Sciscionella marina]
MTTATHQLTYCWVTDAADTEHAVTYDDLARAIIDQHGQYTALCGAHLHPAALTATPNGRCPRCHAALRVTDIQPSGRHRAN